MKLDLDDLERKAKAAEQSAWTTLDAPGRMPEYCSGFAIVKADGGEQIADAYDNTPWPDRQCVANAQHIAAASPPVVLALIARIGDLDEALSDALAHVTPGPERDRLVEVLGAPPSGRERLDRIAKAATAFVDEQGKRVSIERGHTIGQAEDFAGELFAELVRAVEAAGR